HEDRAAAVAYTGCDVITEHNDNIVEAVLAPEPLTTRGVRQGHFAVVITVTRSVAPSAGWAERCHREAGQGAPEPVRTVKTLDDPPKASGRCPVPLALERTYPAPSQRGPEREIPEAHHAKSFCIRSCKDLYRSTISSFFRQLLS